MSDEDTAMGSWNREAGLSSQTRRGILKKSGAAVAGVTAVTGTAAADNAPITSKGVTFSLTPENEGVSSEDSSETEGLKEVSYWNGDTPMKISCSECGNLLLVVDYHIRCFRSYEKDQDGDYHYVYWMWSQTDTDTGNPSSLVRAESKVDIAQESMTVTGHTPDTTRTINQRKKEIGMSLGFTMPGGGGFSASVSDTIFLNDGEYGPWTGEVEVGSAGKFGVSLDANNTTGRQNLKGGLRTRAPNREGVVAEYHVGYTADCDNH
jgi:hypothetical protein